MAEPGTIPGNLLTTLLDFKEGLFPHLSKHSAFCDEYKKMKLHGEAHSSMLALEGSKIHDRGWHIVGTLELQLLLLGQETIVYARPVQAARDTQKSPYLCCRS